jgi:ABC-type multidrug transport system ATPase subunit
LSGIEKVLKFWTWGRKSGTDRTILNDLTGFVKDGEMLLVLGRPGAGCTSLLRVLSGMRGSFTEIDGDVLYGDMDSKEFSKNYRGEVCYNGEEDMNYPTLTTRQTLQFALRNKTPGKLLPEQTRSEFINKTLYLLGNMLGLTKQMDTMVGNAFVRGLSGGERKRLSIAEQMTTRSTINCWDCSTRGLDASSALDYVRSLRILTNIFHTTTVSTLYQASDSIFNLFDKLLVLDEGHVIYFGPTDTAKAYFEEMGFLCPPRKSTPDFLTGLCNPLEREMRPGFEEKVPLDAIAFEERYRSSDMCARMHKELAEYEEELSRTKPSVQFRDAMKAEHQKHSLSHSPYTANYFQQVKALTIRQYQLKMGDKGALITRYGTMAFQGLIMASCFYLMPLTATGAFSRGGALFFCALFNALIAQSELVTYMMGRPVLEKHKQYALYRPSAFYVAQVILDVPLAAIQVVVFQIAAYFMMGLELNAGKFFTFTIVIFFINMTMNGFFRFCGAISPNFFVATQLSGMALITIFTYTGYQIQYYSMHPWLSWLYWIDPITYGFKALISNEMKGQQYSCEGPNSVPYGPSKFFRIHLVQRRMYKPHLIKSSPFTKIFLIAYTDQAYKACIIQGGSPGDSYVTGDAYLWKVFSYGTWQLWVPDFIALVAFFLLFTFATAAVMEWGNV